MAGMSPRRLGMTAVMPSPVIAMVPFTAGAMIALIMPAVLLPGTRALMPAVMLTEMLA